MFDIPMDLKSLEASIIAYEQEPIQKGKIMFYGQSFFTRWGSPKWGYRRLDEDIRMKDGSLAYLPQGWASGCGVEGQTGAYGCIYGVPLTPSEFP